MLKATIKALKARAEKPEAKKQRVGESYILEQLAKLEQSELSPSLKAFLPVYKEMLSSPDKKISFRDQEDEFYIYVSLIYSAYDNILFKIDHLTPIYQSSNQETSTALQRVQTACEKELELLNDPAVQAFILRSVKTIAKRVSAPDAINVRDDDSDPEKLAKLEEEYALKRDREIVEELRPHLTSLPAPIAQGFKQYFNRPAEGYPLFGTCEEKRGKLDDNELLAIYLIQDALSVARRIQSAKTRESSMIIDVL